MNGSRKIWAGITITLWVLVILCPLYILPVCMPVLSNAGWRSHGCTATLYANSITGIFGLLIAFGALHKTFFKISAMLTALSGLLIVLYPTVITGVCGVSTMRCVWGTRPGLIAGGAALIAAGAAGLAMAKKSS